MTRPRPSVATGVDTDLRRRAANAQVRITGTAATGYSILCARLGTVQRSGLDLAALRLALRTPAEVDAERAAERAALTDADRARLEREAIARQDRAMFGWMAEAPPPMPKRVLDAAELDRIDRQARGGR